MEPLILSIDTSCDETSVAITCGRRVLSNIVSSQINIHKKYGGVFPALAKRAHEERIDFVVQEALERSGVIANFSLRQKRGLKSAITNKFQIDAIAVTYGPGLAIALEVGIRKAKELTSTLSLSRSSTLNLIAVDHMEGHIYSTLAQNAMGNPKNEVIFPAICILVSGGHTELVLMENHGKYKVLGSTLDDACGEALDKAAKILKLGYPGGPIIERLAEEYCTDCNSGLQSARRLKSATTNFTLTPPLREKINLNFSYSGLKTQFLYLVNSLSEKDFNENLLELAFTFQSAAFEQLIRKTANAIKIHHPRAIISGGGVLANKKLRTLLRKLAKDNNLPVFFPTGKKLNGDNAAMIGVAAYYKFLRKEFVQDIDSLDRIPRLQLS